MMPLRSRKLPLNMVYLEETFSIYKKHEQLSMAMNVLAEHIVSIKRGWAMRIISTYSMCIVVLPTLYLMVSESKTQHFNLELYPGVKLLFTCISNRDKLAKTLICLSNDQAAVEST
jgi:hypothetical protein